MRISQQRSSVLLASVGFVALVLVIAAWLRWQFWTYGSDTGTFSQAIANTPYGFSDALERGSHFRFHFSPILALLWPLIALARTPFVLQLVQIALIVACPLLLAALLKPYVGDPWSTRIGILALLYPPLLAAAFSEFHELAFYPPLVLALLLCADRARWLPFMIVACALVLIREDATVDLIVLGLVLAVMGILNRRTRERGLLAGEPREPERLAAAGFALTALAVLSLGVYVDVVVPRFGPWAPSHFYDYPFAHGPMQTIIALLTRPLTVIAATATLGRLTYVLEALAPLALLPLFSRWSLLAVPAFAGILLASDWSVWRMGMHYVLLWAPFLLVGAGDKLARTQNGVAINWWRAAIALSLLFLVAFNPMHPTHYLRRATYQHTGDALRAFACVPRSAPVETHDEWSTHEALALPNVAPFDDAPQQFSGYLVYATDWQNARFQRLLKPIDAATKAGRFVEVCSYGAVRVLRATSYAAPPPHVGS